MALEFKKVVAVVDVDDDLADLVFETAKGITASDGELHAIDSNPFITTFESPYASGALEADAEAHRADAERRTKMLDDLAAAHGGASEMERFGKTLEILHLSDGKAYHKLRLSHRILKTIGIYRAASIP